MSIVFCSNGTVAVTVGDTRYYSDGRKEPVKK